VTRGRVERVILGALARSQKEEPPGTRIVALSGGLDSCVLLHVLRFASLDSGSLDGGSLDGRSRDGSEPRDPVEPHVRALRPVAAHFDHGMRAGSASDARWVRGLCRAWGIDLRLGRAGDVPASEAEARAQRYAFLEEVRRGYGDGARVLTAHHADDQAETVLFRALRGTGIDGLAGIRPMRAPGLVRPMLDLWREELEAYASAVGLQWREDPTNEHLGYARNRLRHDLIPSIERDVAPGARRSLVRLSRVAAAERAAWRDALEVVLDALDLRAEDGGAWSVDAEGFRGLGGALRARVLRSLVGRCGYRLDWGGTDRALDFVASTRSGKTIDVGGGTFVGRELDRVVAGRREDARVTAGRGEDARVTARTPGGHPGGRSTHEIVFDQDRIARRVEALGREITAAYDDEASLVVVGLLKGSFVFLADLVRHIRRPLEIDFVIAASYGDAMVSRGEIELLYEPVTDLGGRCVLLVEDIVDSGATLAEVVPRLERRGAKRVDVCALLHKWLPSARVRPRWVGFDAPKAFLVGYGLDHAQDFRHLPYIASL